MIERLETDRDVWDGRRRNGRGVKEKRNVEIKVFASYLNGICGTYGMNRMSFVGLKRVGGEI